MSIRRMAVLCFAACMVTSCDGGGNKSPQPPSRPQRNPLLTLPSDLFTYYHTSDPARAEEFRQFAQKMKWKTNERERKCAKSNCNGEARMQIDAPDGVSQVDFKKVNANEQVLVGRLESVGDEEDFVYKDWLPARKHTSGYIVLVGDANGDVTPWLAVLSRKGKDANLDLYKGSPFYAPCVPQDEHAAYPDTADFKECTGKAPGGGADSVSKRDFTDGLAWFSCTEGCCGSSFPPFSKTPLPSPSANPTAKR